MDPSYRPPRGKLNVGGEGYESIEQNWRAQRRRLWQAGALLMSVILVGTEGYHILGDGLWSWADCLYMAVITLSTVGFGETLPGMDHVPYARWWTLGLIVLGSGSLLYFASTLIAFVIEGDIGGVLRRKRMDKAISTMSGHFIVCGVGNTGLHVVEELATTKANFLVIDGDAERIQWVCKELGHELPHIVGDATDDDILQEAGIERASGVICALHDDPENLYLTLTCRALNEKLRIVTKAVDPDAKGKMIRAGADSVVLPQLIGGLRLASEMIRPQVVQFLDQMLRDPSQPLRVSEISVAEHSSLVGKELRDSGLREKANALVVAIYHDGKYVYSPDPATKIRPGMTLILIADAAKLQDMR